MWFHIVFFLAKEIYKTCLSPKSSEYAQMKNRDQGINQFYSLVWLVKDRRWQEISCMWDNSALQWNAVQVLFLVNGLLKRLDSMWGGVTLPLLSQTQWSCKVLSVVNCSISSSGSYYTNHHFGNHTHESAETFSQASKKMISLFGFHRGNFWGLKPGSCQAAVRLGRWGVKRTWAIWSFYFFVD